jgi:dTDP-4-amino-4,6-dideoxygalactose transaminase
MSTPTQAAKTVEQLQRVELPRLFPREIPPRAYELVREVLDSGFTSDHVERFERMLAETFGAKHAICVANCTAAVHVAIGALSLKPGDEVIVSAITDYGSVMGVIKEDLVPVFADVDPLTGNITVETVERAITPRTKAIVAVHFYGLSCEIGPIADLARSRGLHLIEDMCQNPLGTYDGKLCGTFGDLAALSFDAEKHISTDGGGAVLTNDDELAERARQFAIGRGATHIKGFGRAHIEPGYNYRYSRLQAAVGIAQLEVLREQIQRRMRRAEQLTRLLSDVPAVTPPMIPPKCSHLYWLYHVQFDLDALRIGIDEIAERMSSAGIHGAYPSRYYNMPAALKFLHRSPYNRFWAQVEMTAVKRAMERYHYCSDMCPNALWHGAHTVRWVWTDRYSERDVECIAKIIKHIIADALR